MKLRSTTPASIPLITRLTLIIVTVLITIAVPIRMTQIVSADQYDSQIAALQQEIDGYNTQASKLASQANTLQSAVAELQNQANTIQAQINLSQAKYDKLVTQIAETEKQIKQNQVALGTTMADMYVDGSITPIEMLASSKNISDYLNKQEYQASIRDQLTSTISKITDLKTQLDNQKTDVLRVLGDQKNSKNALVAKQQEKQNLINQTQGQESVYQQLINKDKASQAELQAQQRAAWAAIQSSGGATLVKSGEAASGGYPWNDSNCPMDGMYSTGGYGGGSDGHGYGCRQCASYAAWRVAKETGYYPENWGNAVDFPSSARSVGYQTGSTPRAGSLAVMNAAEAGNSFGHVVWVEAVNNDGTILVSQYNATYGGLGFGEYSEINLPSSYFYTYIYIK